MKTIILTLSLTIGLHQLATADDNPKSEEPKPDSAVYLIRYLDVDRDNAKEFEEAVSKKTKKFNRSLNSDQWYTAKILTGPKTGQYARWFGPKTWADLDKSGSTNTISIDQDNEELKYWIKNVQPLANPTSSLAEIWLTSMDSSYMGLPENEPTRYIALQRWKMKPGMYQRKAALDKLIVKAYKEAGLKVNIGVSRLQSGGDYMTFGRWVDFNKWTDYEKTQKWDKIGEGYDKIYGEGAWKNHLKEHNAIMQENAEVQGEFWEYLEDLSSKELPK